MPTSKQYSVGILVASCTTIILLTYTSDQRNCQDPPYITIKVTYILSQISKQKSNIPNKVYHWASKMDNWIHAIINLPISKNAITMSNWNDAIINLLKSEICHYIPLVALRFYFGLNCPLSSTSILSTLPPVLPSLSIPKHCPQAPLPPVARSKLQHLASTQQNQNPKR